MPGLIRGVARTAVIAGTATTVSNRVSRRQANRWSQQDAAQQQPQQQYAEPPPQQYAPPPPPEPEDDGTDRKLAQLKDLGALKEQGILSEAEFEAQKQKILYS